MVSPDMQNGGYGKSFTLVDFISVVCLGGDMNPNMGGGFDGGMGGGEMGEMGGYGGGIFNRVELIFYIVNFLQVMAPETVKWATLADSQTARAIKLSQHNKQRLGAY